MALEATLKMTLEPTLEVDSTTLSEFDVVISSVVVKVLAALEAALETTVEVNFTALSEVDPDITDPELVAIPNLSLVVVTD